MKNKNSFKYILSLSILMLISSFLQQFFSMVDMYFVGNYIGYKGTAAIGSSGILVTCLIGLFTGISVGMGTIMARFYGSGDIGELYNVFYIGKRITLITSIILTIVGYSYMSIFLRILKVPDNIFNESKIYAQIYILGIIPMILYNIYSAAFRAMGEYKIPIYTLFIGGISNIILDYIFIVKFNLGVSGAAKATIFSQWISFIVIYFIMNKYKKHNDIKSTKFIWKKTYLNEIVRNGLTAGIQAILLTFSNIIIQYYINQFGENEIAAFAAYFKIETLVYLPIMSLGYTTMLIISQNIGEKNYNLITNITKYTLLFGVIITVITSSIILINGEKLFYFFVKSKEVANIGIGILVITFPLYFLYSISELSSSIIRGLGNFFIPMLNSIIFLCIFRIIMASILSGLYKNMNFIIMVYPLTWFLCGFFNLYYIKTKIRR